MRLKINFADFYPGFQAENNPLFNLLKERYEVGLSSEPDFLFYSCFGETFKNYNCVKIFCTGENKRPDFSACDYALSFDHLDDPRNYRWPLYGGEPSVVNALLKPKIISEKPKFCAFVYSNSTPQPRKEFFKKLCEYKQVDSGGAVFNNLGYYVGPDIVGFLSQYKFVIAFENSSYPGYTTEKLANAMLANTVPIYWGNPLVGKDFNTKSFINVHEFPDRDAAIKAVIEADQDALTYARYMNEPYFKENKLNEFVKPENLLKFIDQIIKGGRTRS